MRQALLLITMSLLALGACKKEGAADQPASPGQAAQDTASLPRPLPGLYRSTAQVVSIDMPGMPAEGQAQMKQMMASRAAPHDFCLTGEEAAKGYEERVRKLAGRPDCHFDHYSAVAGKLDAQLTCTARGGPGGEDSPVRSVMSMQGTMSPDGSDLTLGMEQSSAQMPGGGMKMVMHVTSHRVGDCPKS